MATAPPPLQTETVGEILDRFQQSAPVDVLGIAEALGLNVWEDDINPFSGKITRDLLHGGTSGYSVIVNSIESQPRKRFTIAHEIAHFVLHADELLKGDIEETLYRGGLSDRMEVQANKFAAEILMPLLLIERLIEQGKTSIEELAYALEVSKSAMAIRLGASYAD